MAIETCTVRNRARTFVLWLFDYGGLTMTGVLTDSERVVWIRGDRAARYRERADHLKGMANAETRPRERARVLELALEYERLADELAGQKTR
jgi:hypothetical protein